MPSPRSNCNRRARTPVFRREGDYWTIAYDGAVVRLKDAKGLHYLEPLLRQPGYSFHVVELIRAAGGPQGLPSAAEDGGSEAVERARKSVTNRIRQTLLRIAGIHHTLGLHLRNAVHTGSQCTYTPERPIRWSACVEKRRYADCSAI
jgi:hypothetical protein